MGKTISKLNTRSFLLQCFFATKGGGSNNARKLFSNFILQRALLQRTIVVLLDLGCNTSSFTVAFDWTSHASEYTNAAKADNRTLVIL